MAIDRRARVLIVEDDLITSLNERETLEEAGYSVITARTAQEGVHVAQTVRPLDIVIMDIDLGPGIDGLEAAGIILASTGLPLLFVTSHTDEASVQRMAALPACGVIPKDTSNKLLIASVGMALRHGAEAARRVDAAETRLREAHHRVRNNLATIKAIMNMQIDASAYQETVDALHDNIGRLEGISVLYDMLAMVKTGTTIAIEPYIATLIDAILPIFPFAAHVSVQLNIGNFCLDPSRTFALGIITNELLTNVMKYAFKGKERGLIRLCIEAFDESVIMTIQDDGVGLPDSFDPINGGGLGLSLISMLLDQFNGSLTMKNDKGTVSTVRIRAPGLCTQTAPGATHQDTRSSKTVTV